jgi:hypothetical protein
VPFVTFIVTFVALLIRLLLLFVDDVVVVLYLLCVTVYCW